MNSTIYIQDKIPNVLLDFLYGLIDNDSTISEIRLISNALGAGEVQDIICVTMSGSVFRRVFGFSPVNTNLKVEHYDGKHELIAA